MSNLALPAALAATLDDKYTATAGRVLLTGTQALIRLPMLQRERDLAAGLNTAGFISGYRGSPLGNLDLGLWKAKQHLADHHVTFQPGINEDMAATAVWGSQQVGLFPGAKYDGVFGMWYGKGPGVDRCGDVFRHANATGTAQYGGVLVIAGDDHAAKSSTLPHQTEHIFKAVLMPVLYPANVQEYLDYGLHGWAMSRYSGCWVAFKALADTVETSASVRVDLAAVDIVLPTDFAMPAGGLNIRWPDPPLLQEARLLNHRLYAALAYCRVNKLNRVIIDSPNPRLGILTAGKSYLDVRQALDELGIDDALAAEIGVRLYKVGMVWPLEPEGVRHFAEGLEEILVVEEKRQLLEYQLKEELYNWREDVRPRVIGKFDEIGEWSEGNWLLPATGELPVATIARVIAERIGRFFTSPTIESRLKLIAAKQQAANTPLVLAERKPHFCSGCPHNTSTRVPEGSRAVAGIGCHYMVTWMDRQTSTFTHMGGEGVPWVGQAAFTNERHIFANLGDGTYFHSGLLAIRQAIAAGVNITYKLLYNDAVAMTGGQQVGERPEGHSVLQIQKSLTAEGVKKLVIVTDEPEKYTGVALEPGVTVHHRDELDRIQRELREVAGTTVIIYDQTCATEKRRRRKRGKLATPAKRVVINELVCEGCGDCSVQSNCLSVEPVETEFGRKRRINQSTCNLDYSCVKGFCPSFVTVEGGQLKKPRREKKGDLSALPAIPEPRLPDAERAWGIVVAGVGGTGVITIGQLLGTAAHLEGKGVVTQDAGGLAQKGGATWSHVQIANRPEAIHTTKVDTAQADLVIGCEAIVTAGKTTLAVMQQGRTYVAINTHGTPTAAFVKNANWQFPGGNCEAVVRAGVGDALVGAFDAERVALQMLGDSIYTNPLMLGYAWQQGRIPLTRESLLRAIELNGVQIELNKAAFEWGRRCAHDLAAVQALFQAAQVIEIVKKPALDEIVARRVEFLTGYQDAGYAAQYRAFVDKVRAAEAPLGAGTALTEAVARYLFKLMAYKDEYEVARLHTDPAFTSWIAEMFEGDYKIVHHLAPPATAKRNDQGELIKQRYDQAWVRKAFGVLAKLKGLRGGALDFFGRSEERRTERALIDEYRRCIDELLGGLNAGNLALAAQIARIPEEIRGYGHVKARHLAAARSKWDALMAQWRGGGTQRRVA